MNATEKSISRSSQDISKIFSNKEFNNSNFINSKDKEISNKSNRYENKCDYDELNISNISRNTSKTNYTQCSRDYSKYPLNLGHLEYLDQKKVSNQSQNNKSLNFESD